MLTLGLLIRIIARENEAELIKNLKEEHVTIHCPAAYRWVGVVCTIFFLLFIILMTLFPNGTAETWVYFGFGAFVLLGVYLIVASYLWKIDIYKNEVYFIYVSSFGRKYKIDYSSIVGYRDGKNYIRLKTARRSFFVDNKMINVEFLLRMLKKNHIPLLP